MQGLKWFYAIAGGGVVLGIVSYFREEKKCAETWCYNITPSAKWDSNWDRRESPNPKKSVFLGASDDGKEGAEKVVLPTATRHLFFVRHGQYNLKGATDVHRYLTDLGRTQADLTGLRLKQLNLNFNRIVVSTLKRAKETADIIQKYFPHLPLESDEMLCEGSPIPPEPPIGNWRAESSFYEHGARIEAAFRKYFYRADVNQKNDSYELIVCHANVIRYFVCRALQFPPEAWLRLALHHCSFTWIVIRPSGRVIAYAIGDCGHLPPDKMSTS